MTESQAENGVQAKRMKSVLREYVDEVSGEVLQLRHEEAISSRRRPPDEKSTEPFTLLYEAAELAQFRMPPLCWRVLWHLVASQPMGHREVIYSARQIAEELDSQPTNVSAAIGQLVQLGLIVDRDPYMRRLTLNPRYFWRGTPKERRSAL